MSRRTTDIALAWVQARGGRQLPRYTNPHCRNEGNQDPQNKQNQATPQRVLVRFALVSPPVGACSLVVIIGRERIRFGHAE